MYIMSLLAVLLNDLPGVKTEVTATFSSASSSAKVRSRMIELNYLSHQANGLAC